MPAQKRSFVDNPSNSDDDSDQNNHRRRHRHREERDIREEEDNEEDEDEEEEDEEQESGQKGTSPLQNGHQYKQQLQDEAAAEHDKQEDEDEDDEEYEEEEEEEPNRVEDEEEDEDDDEKEQTQDSEESESPIEQGEKPEFVFVELSDIRKDVQCPICLGIIKKTRTVMECLHRFCRECIDKSMRLGNNECPACRTHCASRRSLRDDPNYDALISALYPDIEKYEEEELAFHEEERTRNKQIQASIAQIFQRQSEALVRRRTMGKETTGQFMMRSQRNHRASRRRRNIRGAEFQGSEDNEDENDDNGGKDSSSTDERSTEGRQRRRKRRPGIRPSQPSLSAVNQDGGCNENDIEASRESRGISPGLVWSTEMLAWGRGGTRSHTRHGNSSSDNNKNSRNTRLSRLVEYLRSLEEKNDEFDVHLMLISLDQKIAPSLQQPYLCCRPSLLVRHLREYVAHQTHLQAEAVEIMLVKRQHNPDKYLSTSPPPFSTDELQILEGQETLAWLKANGSSSREHLILAYRWKEAS